MVCRVGKRRLVTLSHGVPASIIVDGVTYYLLRDDDTGDILRDDTNRPLYDEAA